jgi:hypothetical protein
MRNLMQQLKQPNIHTHLWQTTAFLAIAAMWQAMALAQSNPTTEYIRAGGNLVAVLHPPAPHFTDLTGTQYPTDANLLYAEGISAGCQSTRRTCSARPER